MINTDDILSPGQRADGIISPEMPPEFSLSGLAATLIVSGLEDQLSAAAAGYTGTDYLSPVFDAAALLKAKYEGDPDVSGQVASSLSDIVGRAVGAIERDWGVDLAALGLDPGSADYRGDVSELYRFFVCDRVANGTGLVEWLISADRKRIADRWRRSVDKKNQSVSEARKTFQSFDDVVIWISMPSIVESIRAEGVPPATASEVLAALDLEGTAFLRDIAWKHPDESFAAKYAAPVLSSARAVSALVTELRCRWLEESPKKAAGVAEIPEEEE